MRQVGSRAASKPQCAGERLTVWRRAEALQSAANPSFENRTGLAATVEPAPRKAKVFGCRADKQCAEESLRPRSGASNSRLSPVSEVMAVQAAKQLSKGKPTERLGRKVTGLTSERLHDRGTARCSRTGCCNRTPVAPIRTGCSPPVEPAASSRAARLFGSVPATPG